LFKKKKKRLTSGKANAGVIRVSASPWPEPMDLSVLRYAVGTRQLSALDIISHQFHHGQIPFSFREEG
jgi:hypothetical protein